MPSDEDLSTLSEQSGTQFEGQRAPTLPALVLLWLAGEPGRAGEVCTFPIDEPWGPARVLGRGEPRDDDPHRRVQFMRQLQGGTESTPALSNRHVSRVQLVIRAHASGRLAVENVGRCHAYHNGERFDSIELEPGDLIRLGQQVLLMCMPRPAWAPANSLAHDFGQADRHGLVGESQSLWELRSSIRAAATTDNHVLLLGETGTGKELVARAIHAESKNARQPLVARNAATLPEGLIDAELFGNVKNYPNAGMPERPGLVGQAHGSSLFLDEFGELSRALQVHLLRVLDDGEYQRLGEASARRSSFRLIAATNRPVDALREDVLARFKTRVEIPPLSARREDIPLLAQRALDELPGPADRMLPIELVERLVQHTYPGNVRDLQGLVQRYTQEPDFEAWRGVWNARPPEAERSRIDPNSLSREQIEDCLRDNGWLQEKAWRALGLSSRHALARLMRKHGIAQPISH